jgi:hypothetical protein
MATEFIFDNKRVKLPGAYSTIVSGERNTPLELDYGKVLVIDTGNLGATWGGGAGIDGELDSGQDAIYKFDNVDDYRSFLKGGMFWKMADAFFRPDPEAAALGASSVTHVRAATTAAATMTFTAVGGGTNGGTFTIKVRDEGLIGNGEETTGGNLKKGYAFTIETGVIDTAKWIFKIWRGTFKGLHTDGLPYDEVNEEDAEPLLVAQSPEFDNIQTLIDWANENRSFGAMFSLDSTSTATGDGSVDSTDVGAITGYELATGGTETYSTTNLTAALQDLAEENFSFVVTDQYGVDGYDATENGAVLAHILNDAKFKSNMFVGGGDNEDEFDGADGSLEMGAYFDSPYVTVVHGAVGEASQAVSEGFRYWPSIYTASKVVGRTAGKEPQVPITNKTVGVDKLVHNLSKIEKERALDAGVLVLYNNKSLNRFTILQGVNTLQNNKVLFTNTGKSHSIQFMRVVEQINKELIVNSEIDLLSDENGVNVGNLSPGILKNWTESYLQSRTVSELADNLLLDFRNVTVTQQEDAYNVTYAVVVNNEINKIFFTGFLFRS